MQRHVNNNCHCCEQFEGKPRTMESSVPSIPEQNILAGSGNRKFIQNTYYGYLYLYTILIMVNYT